MLIERRNDDANRLCHFYPWSPCRVDDCLVFGFDWNNYHLQSNITREERERERDDEMFRDKENRRDSKVRWRQPRLLTEKTEKETMNTDYYYRMRRVTMSSRQWSQNRLMQCLSDVRSRKRDEHQYEREILKRQAHTHAEKSCCLSVVKLSLLCLCCRIVIPVSRFGSQYFASWRTTVRVLSLEWEKQVHFERCVSLSLSLSEESVQCVVLLQKQ